MLALAGAAAAVLVGGVPGVPPVVPTGQATTVWEPVAIVLGSPGAAPALALLLFAGVTPFLRGAVRYVRSAG